MNGERPAPVAGEIHLYVTGLSAGPSGCGAVLSRDEEERALRFRSDADARRYRQVRCLLRTILAQYTGRAPGAIVFGYGTYGKPFLEGEPVQGLQFSVSHSCDLAAIAVCRGRCVGIDIEQVRDGIPAPGLAKRYLTGAEAAAVGVLDGPARTDLFLRIWTRKEALLKATGEGIGSLCSCPGLLEAGAVSHAGRAWKVRDLTIAPGYAAALAVEGDGGVVRAMPLPPQETCPAPVPGSGA